MTEEPKTKEPKICLECGALLSVCLECGAYYARASSHQKYCAPCGVLRAATYNREYMRAYYHTPKGKANMLKSIKKYQESEKGKATIKLGEERRRRRRQHDR